MTNALAIYHDEPADQQKEEMLAQDWVQANTAKIMDGCEVIPCKARGLGRSPYTPVPVNGISGQHAYLNRLRTKTGAPFLYHRAMSTRGNIAGHSVDLYEMVAADGSAWECLYLDMYFYRRTTLAPEGLVLEPLGQLPPGERAMLKVGHRGVNFYVDEFPLGLPDALRHAADPDDPVACALQAHRAGLVADLLQVQLRAAWRRPCG